MRPEERLAAALDAVPGSTDLEDDPIDSAIDTLQQVRAEIRAAIEAVMLGPVIDESGRRAHTGLNTYIRHDIPIPKVRLIGWQDTLRRALEKL